MVIINTVNSNLFSGMIAAFSLFRSGPLPITAFSKVHLAPYLIKLERSPPEITIWKIVGRCVSLKGCRYDS